MHDTPTPTFGDALQQFAFTDTPNTRITRQPTNLKAASRPATKASPKQTPSPSPKRKSPPTTTTTTTPPKKKKKPRTPSTYAPPSKYAHLPNNLTDSLSPHLICLFIGVNPGLRTATTGHAYAHPSNLFWKLCHRSRCTPRLCAPAEDHDLPRLYALGHTNIVSRATRDAAELSRGEMDAGVAVLEEKCRVWRPESVCVVGKGVWEAVWRVRRGRGVRRGEFRYGWQGGGENMGVVEEEEGWEGSRVFVATSTSGLAAGMRPCEKEEVWRELGEWVRRRRAERGIPDEGMGVGGEREEGSPGRLDVIKAER